MGSRRPGEIRSNQRDANPCGDATRSYSPHKLDQFTRQLVYLRPEVFVVFDRVVSTKAEFPKRWLLHTNDMPAPLDGEDTRDPNECQAGEYLAKEAREARAAHYLSTARTRTAAHMEGRLFVTTLLPKKGITRAALRAASTIIPDRN